LLVSRILDNLFSCFNLSTFWNYWYWYEIEFFSVFGRIR